MMLVYLFDTLQQRPLRPAYASALRSLCAGYFAQLSVSVLSVLRVRARARLRAGNELNTCLPSVCANNNGVIRQQLESSNT
jgi:hypothetical protein